MFQEGKRITESSYRGENQIHKETPIGPIDTLIDAHAKALNLTLVTNNTKGFARVDGLELEDWV